MVPDCYIKLARFLRYQYCNNHHGKKIGHGLENYSNKRKMLSLNVMIILKFDSITQSRENLIVKNSTTEKKTLATELIDFNLSRDYFTDEKELLKSILFG